MFFIVTSGASICGAWLAWASRKNGKETRELIKEMDERAEKRHREIMATVEKRHEEIMATIEKRHQEVLLALDKGFGTLIQQQAQ